MGFKDRLEKNYSNFPVWVQNLFVTVQGFLFRRRRFNKNFYHQLSAAINRSTLDFEELKLYQLARAREFLRHAQTTSPYWKEQFEKINFAWEDFNALDDIRNLPILEKDELRNRALDIKSNFFNEQHLELVHTSGTSGKPLTVWLADKDTQERQAILFRMFNLFGIKPFEKSVRFSGRTLFQNSIKNRKFWRYNAAINQLLMSSYDLHPDNMQDYVNKLIKFNPTLIDGYPSSIFILAKYINRTSQSGLIKPKAIMTTAETLEDYQRSEISLAFGGCSVINQYASSEGAPFITQDLNGEMVVNIDTGIFEFVKPGTDIIAKPGEIAEMLVTSFTTHGTPLIRYRIGDTVQLTVDEKFSNCWNMPIVSKVLGRQEDVLYTKERGFIPSLNKVFSVAPLTIKEAQIVQVDIDLVEFRIVIDKTRNFEMKDLDRPIKELRDRLGNIEIRVKLVERLERGANGKLRAVVGSSDILKYANQ